MTPRPTVGRASRIVLLGLLLVNAPLLAAAERTALKVCADPYNMPFSNEEQQGFENRIAELMAEWLELPLEYAWFPQRMGFIRNTLRAEIGEGVYKCDLVMGVPDRFELAATTEPYYASTWSLVYAKGRSLDDIRAPGDVAKLPQQVRNELRFGLFDRGPAQLWVFKQGLMGQAVPYPAQLGHLRDTPTVILQDMLDDKVDITMIWGPFAGYFLREHAQGKLAMLPMSAESQQGEMKFNYNIAMAVRYGEKEWKQQVNRFIVEQRDAIRGVLEDYGVPLVAVEQTAEDDD